MNLVAWTVNPGSRSEKSNPSSAQPPICKPRPTIKNEIRIPKIRRIHPPRLKHKLLSLLLILEHLAPLRYTLGNAPLRALLHARPISPLLNNHIMHSRHLIILRDRLPNPELVQRGHGGTIQVRFIRVRVAVHGRVDGPFDEFQRGVEARWKAVADGSVEVIAEDQVVAVDGFLEDDGEGNGVLVVLVEGVREVGVCFGRVVRVALFPDRELLFPRRRGEMGVVLTGVVLDPNAETHCRKVILDS
ncbi:hypothetical protein GB937_002490 [Aspergillus fischeri]|nr:hypothetical protein GB937_002490 [Aspergillus fischeri]